MPPRRPSRIIKRRRTIKRRCSSRLRGDATKSIYTMEQEEADMQRTYAEKKALCESKCIQGSLNYNNCTGNCDTPEYYVGQYLCDRELKKCSTADDGRRCYPRTVNTFLFHPDASIIGEARNAIPQLYKNQFKKDLLGCEDLMKQHETYLANKRTGKYVIGQLYDCQMQKIIEELQTKDVDKHLKGIMCRKSNYSV